MDAFLGFLVGMFVNEAGELALWASRKLVLLAALAVHRDPERRRGYTVQLNETLALVPGKATCLPAALLIVGVVLVGVAWRSRTKARIFTFLFTKLRMLRHALARLRREVIRLRFRRHLRR
ncbi:hypothetical protein ACFLIM_39085 [Nonomuraea sp. M3C6]|uniref:Uncharacterized protein n=1 Tax=Nonomuraea marmarensis TaxID=3351344 RepID=A0ABW7AQA0_9ACTN